MVEHVLLKRIKNVYDKLNSEYNKNNECDDGNWFKEINNWSNIKKSDQNIPDYYFILNLCYGPWRVKRQKDVWQNVYQNFKSKCKGDLQKIAERSVNIGFPFEWQENRALFLSEYLNDKGITFAQFLQGLKSKNGLEVRDTIGEVVRATPGITKTISTFVRDWLRKDVFPIDTRVEKLLSYLGLPRGEEMMVFLSRKVGANPRIFNRILYRHYGERCDKGIHNGCPVYNDCYFRFC